MRYIGRSSGLFWAVTLGFAAGAICVSIAPSLRSPSIQGQAGSSISEPDSTSMRRSAGAVSSVDRSPVSSSQPLVGESIRHLAWADAGLECVEIITARNIFRRGRNPASRGNNPSSSDSGEVADQTQTQATRPPLFRLLGTVASDERDSYAVLEMIETKAQDIYRIGQTIGDARIDRIEQNRVVVVRDGSREILELILTGQPSTHTPTNAALPPSIAQSGPEELLRIMADGNRQINTAASTSQASQMARSFLSKIELSPSVVDGESVGLRISGLEDSTMAQLIGLKDGDVIQSVNRHPVTSRRKAVQVLRKARRLGSAELGLMRDQQSKSLVFRTSSW